MNTPLTTAEIAERLREQRTITLTDINAVRAYLDETSVLHHEAASALLALEEERDEAKTLLNRYAWERDKAREERDAAERKSEAFWKPRLEAAEAELAKVRAELARLTNAGN